MISNHGSAMINSRRRQYIMRKFLSLLLLACALLGARASGPVRWLTVSHDFGAIAEEAGPVTATFSFVNDGTAPVTITSARSTCGCTTPEYPSAAVAPGDTARITVQYDPAQRPGRFVKKVYVRTSGSPERDVLSVRGVVVGSAETVSARFPVAMGKLHLRRGAMMMGRVLKGRAKMEYLEGYNRSEDTLSPRVVSQPPYLELTAVPGRVPPGEQLQLNAYLRTDRCPLYGLVEDTVLIEPAPGEAVIALPLTAVIAEDFSRLTPGELARAPQAALSEDRVDFGIITAPTATATATLTNRGASTLKVRRIYSDSPAVAATIAAEEIKKGKSATITVTATPEASADAVVNARITIITNSPSCPELTLRAVGTRR